jgi:hypothetical protein
MSTLSGVNNSGNWNNRNSKADIAVNSYVTNLPEIYTGHPNRITKYNSYEIMCSDSEVSSCLDIIAEFSTQKNTHNKTPFKIDFSEKPNPHEVDIISKQLQQWCKLNNFDTRMFKIFRNTLKYGDQVFVRDPENFKLYWVDMCNVLKVIVNESEGKNPEQYVIKDININLQNLSATQKVSTDVSGNSSNSYGSGSNNQPLTDYNSSSASRFTIGQAETVVDAKNIMHLSLTEGLDKFWPFGQSILENIFKVYKQKELLEDAILIYRINRAPERRMFKIDVGNMPPHMANAYVERIKNEIHQKKIPASNDSSNMVDSRYNSLSINEDYYFPVSSDGKGSSIEMLAGGAQLGELNDLLYFNNKMARGLRIPSSYLPTGPEEGNAVLNDGRVGNALIQEHIFNSYCIRLQNYISSRLDDEFKLFMKWRGFNIDSGLYSLSFNEPQNFASYRQSELDSARVSIFSAIEPLPYMSKRFSLERFLGLTEEELAKNTELWKQEQNKNIKTEPQGTDLRNVGISSGDFGSDQETMDELDSLPDNDEIAPVDAAEVDKLAS